MSKEIIDKQYFDDMYAASQDPWNFTGSMYEQEKYQHTITALGGEDFINGLEIGCSIGVLTKMLSEYCTSLLGVDISEKPILIARERLKDNLGVKFEVFDIPRQYPDNQFDLIVVSEVAYYLSEKDLISTKSLILNSLADNGTLCLVHWRPQIDGCAFNGDQVNDSFLNDGAYNPAYQYSNDQYRIDVIKKR